MSISPKTQFKIQVNKKYITYIAGNRNITAEEVKQTISDILSETLNITLTELEEWINKYVPKRTGQLRESLIRNLHSSRVKGMILRLILGTSLDYAEEVNEMSTAQVAHSGEKGYAYYYGNYGPIILNDPEAIGNFWDELLDFAKRRILINLTKAKYNALSGSLKVSDVNKLVS